MPPRARYPPPRRPAAPAGPRATPSLASSTAPPVLRPDGRPGRGGRAGSATQQRLTAAARTAFRLRLRPAAPSRPAPPLAPPSRPARLPGGPRLSAGGSRGAAAAAARPSAAARGSARHRWRPPRRRGHSRDRTPPAPRRPTRPLLRPPRPPAGPLRPPVPWRPAPCALAPGPPRPGVAHPGPRPRRRSASGEGGGVHTACHERLRQVIRLRPGKAEEESVISPAAGGQAPHKNGGKGTPAPAEFWAHSSSRGAFCPFSRRVFSAVSFFRRQPGRPIRNR